MSLMRSKDSEKIVKWEDEDVGTEITFFFVENNDNATEVGMVDFFHALTSNTTLTFLDVSVLSMNNKKAVQALADFLKSPTCALRTLYMESTSIHPDNFTPLAEALADNNTLVKLGLNSIRFGGDTGVQMLCKALEFNTALEHLELRFVGMTETGAAAVAQLLLKNRTISQINLNFNQIGDEGAVSIFQSLAVNKTLTYLQMWNNDITSVGCIAFADALKINRSLTHIEFLVNSNMVEAGLAALAEALSVNHTICSIDNWSYAHPLFIRLAENRIFRNRIKSLKKKSRALFEALDLPTYDANLDCEERFAQELFRDAAAQVFDRLRYRM